MNNKEILKEILNDKELINNWKDLDIDSVTTSNLLNFSSVNKKIKLLYILFENDLKTKQQILNNIKSL